MLPNHRTPHQGVILPWEAPGARPPPETFFFQWFVSTRWLALLPITPEKLLAALDAGVGA